MVTAITPRKGYKQTDIGEIPEDWEITKLGDIGDSIIGLTYSPKNVSTQGKLVHRSSNIQNNKLAYDDNVYVDVEVDEKLILRDGDILICVRNGSRNLIGKSAIIKGRAVGETFGAFMSIFRTKTHPPLIFYVILSDIVQRQIMESLGATINQITNKTLNNFRIPLSTNKHELELIGAALSDVDALIDSLDALIAKKKDIKAGVMQELLTGKRRLPGFNGKWQSIFLGKFGSTYGGLIGKTKKDFGVGSGRYIPFLNVLNNSIIDSNSLDKVTVEQGEGQNCAKKGDLFFNGSSETPEELGVCAVLLDDIRNVYLNSFCFGFRPLENAPIHGLFLAYFFRSNEGRKLIYALAQGATRYNLSKTALMNLQFQIPELEEQVEISNTIHEIEIGIHLLEIEREKIIAVKAGMMQQLLTGNIRLI